MERTAYLHLIFTIDMQRSWAGEEDWCCNCSWSQSYRDSLYLCSMHCGNLHTLYKFKQLLPVFSSSCQILVAFEFTMPPYAIRPFFFWHCLYRFVKIQGGVGVMKATVRIIKLWKRWQISYLGCREIFLLVRGRGFPMLVESMKIFQAKHSLYCRIVYTL